MNKLNFLLPISGFLGLVYMTASIFQLNEIGFATGAVVGIVSFVCYFVIDNKIDNGSYRN